MKKTSLNNLKIRNKLLLIYFFCVLIPIIMTDVIILYTVNHISRSEKAKDVEMLMERIAYNLNETIEVSILFTNNTYIDRQLNDFLNKSYGDHADYYYEYIKLLNNNRLSNNYSNGILSKIQVFADNNTIINGGKIATVDMIRDTEWYQAYKESGEKIFVYIYYDEMKRYATGSGTSRTISIIRNLDNFGSQGIEKLLKIDIDYNLMHRDILNEKIDGDIYVRNHNYIIFSNQKNENSMKPYVSAHDIPKDKVSMSKKFTTGRQRWEIIVTTQYTAFWTVILNHEGLPILVYLNIFIPSILIYFVGKSISKRLSLVVAHMDKVEKELFEEIDNLPGEDEIGGLIRSYNIMVRKIRDLIEVVFKGKAETQALELSKKQAELKAIQSQVNPHFLFNTLESIRMRSLIKGENETAGIIEELALLFRKGMLWGEDYITIREELDFVDKYINIQKYRFGDKLKYYHYVMEECKDYLIPKLAIATFVENAFVHGIEMSAEDGVVSLTITKSSEYLFIEISDNGRGIEQDKLSEIREIIQEADSKRLMEAKSTGILNSVLRLKMSSDSNLICEIDSEPHKGTDISIRIPLISMDDVSGIYQYNKEGDGVS